MQIASQFSALHPVDSFSEYYTPRFYQDTRKSITKQPSSVKKRQTYINDLQKIAKKIPGPGKYNLNPQQKKIAHKFTKKIDFKKLQQIHKGKATYLDEIIKKSKKIPPVGKYNTQVDHTEELKSKYKKKGDEDRKKAPLFRPTIADIINIDTVKIAPGHYEVLKPLGFKSQLGTICPQQKHQRTESLPKLPSACDYNPIPVSYDTFSRKKSLSSLNQPKKPKLNIKQKKLETVGPGPKYSLIVDWALKKDKNGNNKGSNYLKYVHTPRSTSVYH